MTKVTMDFSISVIEFDIVGSNYEQLKQEAEDILYTLIPNAKRFNVEMSIEGLIIDCSNLKAVGPNRLEKWMAHCRAYDVSNDVLTIIDEAFGGEEGDDNK